MAIRVSLNDKEEGAEWALLKETRELNAGDRRAARGAVATTLGTDGKTLVYPGDYDDQLRNAVLSRVIKDWNLTKPVPNGDPSVLDELTIEQIDKLYEAVQPHIDYFNGVPNPEAKGTDPT